MPTLRKLTAEEAEKYRQKQQEAKALSELIGEAAEEMKISQAQPNQNQPGIVNRMVLEPPKTKATGE